MKFLHWLCLAGALASALNADTIIYDNVSESSAGADGVDFVGPPYNSFTSDAAEQITRLQFILSGDDTSSGAVDVILYADNSTTPGELIAVPDRVDDSALCDTAAIYDIALAAFPLLTDDRRYWVGLTGTTPAEWSCDYDDSGVGVADEFFANQIRSVFERKRSLPGVVTEAVSAAPEPSSGFLIVAGVLALLRRHAVRHYGACVPGRPPGFSIK